jgi:hypothetical protein
MANGIDFIFFHLFVAEINKNKLIILLRFVAKILNRIKKILDS